MDGSAGPVNSPVKSWMSSRRDVKSSSDAACKRRVKMGLFGLKTGKAASCASSALRSGMVFFSFFAIRGPVVEVGWTGWLIR